MLSPIYYNNVYLFVVLVFTLFYYNRYHSKSGGIYEGEEFSLYAPQKETLGFLLMLAMVFFIGTRPISGAFCDMVNYYRVFKIQEGRDFSYDPTMHDALWSNLMAWWASARLGYTSFMVLVASLYFGVTYKALTRIFPGDKVVAYLVFLGAFSTFSYGTNGMRAGVAGAIFLLALSYTGNWKVTIPLALVSYFVHHSMVLPIFAFFAALTYRKTNVYLGFWLVCVLISALHITWFQDIFAQLSSDSGDKSGAGYLSLTHGSGGWYTGFRLDFILYSAMPVVVSYYTVLRKRIQSEYYSFLINIYLITNSIWMLCMYASYTNRIAYLSWFLYPVVLIYPFLNEDWGENRYKIFALVMLAHLGFTLGMHFIYYQV